MPSTLLHAPSSTRCSSSKDGTIAAAAAAAAAMVHNDQQHDLARPSSDLQLQLSYVPKAYIWPEKDRPGFQDSDSDADSQEEEAAAAAAEEEELLRWTSTIRKVPAGGSSSSMPVIDIQKVMIGEESEMEKLAWACEEWGGFYGVGHGLEGGGLLGAVMEACRDLFGLPLPVKLRALRCNGSYDGYGKAHLARFFKSLMWSEGFTMMDPHSIATTTSKLIIPPNAHNPFRDTFEEFEKVMRDMACKLLNIIIEGLGVNMNEFKSKQFDPTKDCQGALQLNHYPPCPEPTMTIGLAPHTDSTCLTVLYQEDNVTGLEMCRHGQWVPISPLKDSFVVHVGDMLQVLSNGKYKSVTHRAVVNKKKSRHSIVYFCAPPLNVTIHAPHEVVESSKSQYPLYKPLKWGDYLQARNKYFLDALNTFKND